MSATITNAARPVQRRQLAGLRAFIRQIASIPQETQAHIARVKDAHAVQAQFSALTDEACADLGLSAEDILSAPTYSENLPFFMQAGFGKRA
jgi:hypothetical protein